MNGSTPLTNSRRERFAQELAKGASQAEAYRQVGYKNGSGTDQAASRLLRNVEVAGRVDHLKTEAAKQAEVDAAYVLRQLKALAELPIDTPSHSAQVAALNLLGKHLGLFDERHRVDGAMQLEIRVVRELPPEAYLPLSPGDEPA